MEIVCGKVDSAPAFRDEGMRMVQFSHRLVHLGASAAGDPDGGYVGMCQRDGEVVKAGSRLATKGNQGVDRTIDNRGCLAQRVLRRNVEVHLNLNGEIGGIATPTESPRSS